MNQQPNILVVDDESKIRTMLRRYLTGEGFKVAEAADGTELRAAMERDAFDLVLLDLVLPGEDGLSLARHIRQKSQIPVIMLTGKGDLIDRVAGLEAGADDYVPKPFHLREVLARIRTVLRRSTPAINPGNGTPPPVDGATPGDILVFEGWRLNLPKRELSRTTGEPVPLTTGEFELLRVFALHANRVLNRDQLLDLIKGREWEAFDRAIDTQVGRLRKKIESDPGSPNLIKTVRGAGYIFTATVTGR